MLDPQLVGREARIVEELRAVDDVEAQGAPVLEREDRKAEELPVAGRERAVGAEDRMTHPRSRGRLAPVPPHVREIPKPVDHRVEERDRYPSSFPCLRAAGERAQRRHRRVAPGADVADRDPDPRRLGRCARHRDQARLSLHDEVVGVLAGVRPVLAVAGDVDVDDVLPQRAHGFLTEADAVGPARGVVLEEDVAPLDQPLDRRAVLGVLDVEGDAPLPAVHPDEAAGETGGDRVPRPRDVAAAGPLDLDDVGAEVGEEARGERAGEAVLEGENAGPREERHPRTVTGTNCRNRR